MPTYVTLLKFTDQGVRNIKDTLKRSEAAKERASQAGARIKDIYWLQGQHDIVLVSEAPDETTAMAFALNTAKQGNVTTQTMRAFTAAEMEAILAKVT